jgi:RNA polymerase sigma-70 factor (ECF subfamily)
VVTSQVAPLPRPPDALAEAIVPDALAFDDVYQAHFAFVWRSLRALGVPDAGLDDAAQDVFVVVHRRLAEFEGRAAIRTWLYALARGIASNHRRSARRRPDEELVHEPASGAASPAEAAERAQALRAVLAILDAMDEPRRAVFALVELEGLTAPEAAEVLGEKLNTVYSRLRSARAIFEEAARRRRGEP